jgi:2-methylcitrate dehydratase PrpD
MTDDTAWPLAQHICRTRYADLPSSTIQSTRRDILDTLGCMLGGSGSPGIAKLFAVLEDADISRGGTSAVLNRVRTN